MTDSVTGQNPDTNPETEQDSESGEPAAPASGSPREPTTAPAGEDNSDAPEASSDEETSEVAKLRREAARYRTQLRKEQETRARIEREHAEAKLSEDERKDKRLAELERRDAEREAAWAEDRLGREVERAASALRFHRPERVLALLDRDRVEFEDGRPTNVGKLVSALAKSDPYLIAGAPAVTSPTNASAKGAVETDAERVARVRGVGARPDRGIPSGNVLHAVASSIEEG